MGIFNFRAAGEITFGAGSIGDAGTIIKRFGGNRVLMVVDSGEAFHLFSQYFGDSRKFFHRRERIEFHDVPERGRCLGRGNGEAAG